MSLNHIDVYGFDYDYTLATYNQHVHEFIYSAGLNYLVDVLKYPSDILNFRFDRSFAIRGLHFDRETGYLLKLDQFSKVQYESVHLGRQRVPPEKVLESYPGFRMTSSYRYQNCHMFTDLFCLSEMCLLSDVIEHFVQCGAPFSPFYVFQDIRNAINHIHVSGLLHNAIAEDTSTYLDENPLLGKYLQRLRDSGRKLFLLTNSPFFFVDAGMRFLLKDFLKENNCEWPELFDVVVTNAKKPYFYTSTSRGFRTLDKETGAQSIRPVKSFERGTVYSEGSLGDFMELSGFYGPKVLYMGDQIYADLVEPQRNATWKTAGIIKEVEYEVRKQSSQIFRYNLALALQIDNLIALGQDIADREVAEQVELLKEERKHVRNTLRDTINPNFGSVFRTENSRTMFYYNVARYADVYTSNIINFLQFPTTHCFYSGRQYFPHEHTLPAADVLGNATEIGSVSDEGRERENLIRAAHIVAGDVGATKGC